MLNPDTPFIGRSNELALLEEEYQRTRPSLLVVYGRRRVGKSTLILKSLEETKTWVYHQASRLTDSDNLELLKKSLMRQLNLPSEMQTVLAGLSTWAALFTLLPSLGSPGWVLVLDEFPYLCETNPALPSLLQTMWDGVRNQNTAFKLVLCGSSIALMESLLAERNPLRGRQTVELNLQPLNFREVAQALPYYTPEERLLAYGFWGGLPYYLSLLDPKASLLENLQNVTLRAGAPLYDEANLLLQAELNSPARYASILHAMSDGCHDYGEILGRVKDLKDRSQLAPYMQKLQELRLIEIQRPFDASPKERNSRYVIADPFLMFWFRFVLPNRSALEAGHHKAVLEQVVQPHLSEYMGLMFERICRDYLRFYGQEIFGVPAKQVGQIWAADFDLDVVAELLDGSMVVGECKWWNSVVGENIVARLEETSKPKKPTYHLLFSRQGFSPALKKQAKARQNIFLLEPKSLLSTPKRSRNK